MYLPSDLAKSSVLMVSAKDFAMASSCSFHCFWASLRVCALGDAAISWLHC